MAKHWAPVQKRKKFAGSIENGSRNVLQSWLIYPVVNGG